MALYGLVWPCMALYGLVPKIFYVGTRLACQKDTPKGDKALEKSR